MAKKFSDIKIDSDNIELIIPTYIEKTLTCLKLKSYRDITHLYKITFKNICNQQLFVENEADLRDVLRQYCLYKKLCQLISDEMNKVGLDFHIVDKCVEITSKKKKSSIKFDDNVQVQTYSYSECSPECGKVEKSRTSIKFVNLFGIKPKPPEPPDESNAPDTPTNQPESSETDASTIPDSIENDVSTIPESTENDLPPPEPTENDLLPPEPTENDLPPESTENDLEQPESTENDLEPPESTENDLPPPESTENDLEPPESTENDLPPPEPTENELAPPEPTENDLLPLELTENDLALLESDNESKVTELLSSALNDQNIEIKIPSCMEESLDCLKATRENDITHLFNITLLNMFDKQLFVESEVDLRDVLRQYCIFQKISELIDAHVKMMNLEFQINETSVEITTKKNVTTIKPLENIPPKRYFDISLLSANPNCSPACGNPSKTFLAELNDAAPESTYLVTNSTNTDVLEIFGIEGDNMSLNSGVNQKQCCIIL